jgi:hypothetical protein
MIARWHYAVVQRTKGGERFLLDYDTETKPRTGRFINFGPLGVFKVVDREDPKLKGDARDIGILYVKEI